MGIPSGKHTNKLLKNRHASWVSQRTLFFWLRKRATTCLLISSSSRCNKSKKAKVFPWPCSIFFFVCLPEATVCWTISYSPFPGESHWGWSPSENASHVWGLGRLTRIVWLYVSSKIQNITQNINPKYSSNTSNYIPFSLIPGIPVL